MKTKYHKNLTIDKWRRLSLAEQLANIGVEVKRAIFWKQKQKQNLAQSALFRALELFDLTLNSSHHYPTLKEVARAREVVVDFLFGQNQYRSDANSLNRYFYHFNHLASKQKQDA